MLMTSYRTTALLGALLLVAGGLILLLLQPNGGLLWGRLAAFMVGAGMGLCNTTFLVSVQNAAHHSIRGIATACTVFTRMMGSAIGTAILGATLNLNLQYRLPQTADPVQQLMEPGGAWRNDAGKAGRYHSAGGRFVTLGVFGFRTDFVAGAGGGDVDSRTA
ncbi:Uncharacterised protein [Serratia plymuthica]|uniref:Uncharacterized protein n=1 Tax=Serratia plymuthica TaxID=82996 RepID=A0A2X4V227_SERPL|nr:Uncharacterised protein [Serratia plymuthica]